jgi:hypothetical protein
MRLGGGDVDRNDLGMGIGARQNRAVQHARQFQVIGIARGAGDLVARLEPRHRGPDRIRVLAHEIPLYCRLSRAGRVSDTRTRDYVTSTSKGQFRQADAAVPVVAAIKSIRETQARFAIRPLPR